MKLKQLHGLRTVLHLPVDKLVSTLCLCYPNVFCILHSYKLLDDEQPRNAATATYGMPPGTYADQQREPVTLTDNAD